MDMHACVQAHFRPNTFEQRAQDEDEDTATVAPRCECKKTTTKTASSATNDIDEEGKSKGAMEHTCSEDESYPSLAEIALSTCSQGDMCY